jgi:hypothetical protein
MLDAKTGKLITTSDFLVRIDHEQTVHANWVVENEDGTGKLTLPDGVTVFSIHGAYDSSTVIYVNCDSATEKVDPVDHWYKVSEILTSGVLAPNNCRSLINTAKIKPVAKPGEFVFLVRKRNWREQMQEDYSSR